MLTKRDFLIKTIDAFTEREYEGLCSSSSYASGHRLYSPQQDWFLNRLDQLYGPISPAKFRWSKPFRRVGAELRINRRAQKERATALAFMLAMYDHGDLR